LPDLKAEFSREPYVRGILGMARAQSPNSANSQFFITYADARFLDNQYTVFGRVIDGMKYVDQIEKGEGQSGMVRNPDIIVKMQMADDAK
jgi:cyclophilin family peptidyl-prolyl cis-trans isomerase